MAAFEGARVKGNASNAFVPVAPLNRGSNRWKRRQFGFFVISLMGLLASTGDLVRELLLSYETGVSPSSAKLFTLAGLILMFLVHASFCIRSIFKANMKGSL